MMLLFNGREDFGERFDGLGILDAVFGNKDT